MTLSEINDVLNCVELTHPVELADVIAIRDALGCDAEVFHRLREVIVQVRRGGEQVYERRLAVKGAPELKRLQGTPAVPRP